MINRIRDIRIQKGMTLAQVAAACQPPTTAQTIGRLETGMRNLSLVWMNRIASALKVEPELLLRSESTAEPRITAVLTQAGAEAPHAAGDALLPTDLGGGAGLRVLSVEASVGEYRAGDQIWLREIALADAATSINRDVLVPLPAGRFAFGRLFESAGNRVGLLPPGGTEQVAINDPAWLAVAEMLVRRL